MGKLTALKVKSLKSPGRYADGDCLYLYVHSAESRSWIMRVRFRGKVIEMGLGSEKMVSLAEARELAIENRKLLKSGVDPRALRRAATAEKVVPTFEQAATEVHRERVAGWRNGKHQDQWLSSLRRHAFPTLGRLLPEAIDAALIVDTLLPIWQTRPETARRVKQRIMTILNWAHSKGYRVTEAPERAVEAGLARQPKKGDRHFAALPYEEVPDLMRVLQGSATNGRLALQFLILTGARSGEVRGATWGEIDFTTKLWTIPSGRMKAGREHVVPLSPAAVRLLRIAHAGRTGHHGTDEPIFPGQRGGALSDMTLTKVLRTATKKAATVHGFRSSFRDWAAEKTDFDGAVVEAALAHTNPNKVEAAYRRTNYLEKRWRLMRLWAVYLARTRD